MLLTHILPFNEVERLNKYCDYLFVLGFWKQATLQKYRDMVGSKILMVDNGFYENRKSMEWNKLLDVARFVKATHIYLPDTEDMDTTLDLANKYQTKEFKQIIVLKGKTYKEWEESLDKVLRNNNLWDLLAIPNDRIASTYELSEQARLNFIRTNFPKKTKRIMITGLFCPKFLPFYADWCEFCDTKAFVKMAYCNVHNMFEWNKKYIAEYYDIKLSSEQLKIFDEINEELRKYK